MKVTCDKKHTQLSCHETQLLNSLPSLRSIIAFPIKNLVELYYSLTAMTDEESVTETVSRMAKKNDKVSEFHRSFPSCVM